MKLHRKNSLLAIGVLGIASLSLMSCSADSPEAAAGATPQSPSADAPEARGFSGVSGKIAVSGDGVLQVQDSDSQTAVGYTEATTITQEVQASLSDISTGVCISAIGGDDSGGAVTTVQITEPVDGECTIGMGGMARGVQGGMGGEPPEGFTPPEDGEAPEGMTPPGGGEMPEGMQPPEGGEGMPGGGFGGATSGTVTAVDGSTITVESTSFDGETREQTITVDDLTAFTKTHEATSEALTVGACVVAIGEYEGAQYAATSLAVSEAGEDGCVTGFGGAGGGFPGRGGEND